MPRKNRPYKRGEPHRDARLFVIACEGARREKVYFETMVARSQKVKVKILAPNEADSGSAPKWVLDRAVKYVEEIGLSKHDQLWLVMDFDRHGIEHLRAIAEDCIKRTSWNTAYSNPCFEVWLYFHVDEIANSISKNCAELKTELAKKIKGGYNAEKFTQLIDHAIGRAAMADSNPEYYMPEKFQSKVYKLANAIKMFLEGK